MATVSTVTKVKDKRHVYQYDLSDGKLVIEYRYGRKEPIRITIGAFPLNTLRELLGVPFVTTLVGDAPPADRPPDSLPKDGLQGKATEDGLIETEDHIVSGMDQ